jgi:hypothetical protein
MKKLLLAAAAAAAMSGMGANAQVIIINSTGLSVYSQDFNGLPSSGSVASAFSSTSGTQTHIGGLGGVTGMNGWHGSKIAGTGTTATALAANDGSANSGGIYSYGGVSSTDRALGMLASGTNIMAFGALFQNNTGLTLNDVSLSFTGEFWRSSTTTQNVLAFGFGIVDGVTITNSNFLTATASSDTDLNIVGPLPVVTNGPLDGNTNFATFSNVSITGFTVNPGESFFIRWSDLNEAGNDAGLAVDSFSVNVTAIPEPTTAAMLVGAVALMALRRRRLA